MGIVPIYPPFAAMKVMNEDPARNNKYFATASSFRLCIDTFLDSTLRGIRRTLTRRINNSFQIFYFAKWKKMRIYPYDSRVTTKKIVDDVRHKIPLFMINYANDEHRRYISPLLLYYLPLWEIFRYTMALAKARSIVMHCLQALRQHLKTFEWLWR